jgi:hypothetical protein
MDTPQSSLELPPIPSFNFSSNLESEQSVLPVVNAATFTPPLPEPKHPLLPQLNFKGVDEKALLRKVEKHLRKQNNKGKQSARNRAPHSGLIIISADTEYQLNETGDGNIIISYQFVVAYKGRRCSGIIYTNTHRKEGRIRFEKFVGTALNKALADGVIDQLPKAGEEILFAAHFLRADLFTFANAFDELKTKVSGIRKTVASLKDTYGVDPEEIRTSPVRLEDTVYYDDSRHAHTVNISFYDTLLLSPAGKQSLAEIGKLVGCKKLDLPEGHTKDKMLDFLQADKAAFEEYAINDAMICALYMELMITFSKEELDSERLSFTLGSAALKALKKNLPKGYSLDGLFGYTTEKCTIFPEGNSLNKQPRTVTKRVPIPARDVLERLAIMCYHGGRNEAFHNGPTEEGVWHDYDLPSCYTAITMGLRPLDYEKLKETKNLDDYKGDVFGIACVEFSTPNHVKYPPLPCRASNNRGLFFVRNGRSFCTAQEIEVARNLGVDVKIVYGFTIPWVKGSPRIFKPFMQEVRRNRKRFKGKNDLFEKLWKEIGNSLYGKLAQGLRGKTAFDMKYGTSSKIPPSEITNALFAAYVTGVARAVICEMLNGIEEPFRAVSVTTDGFLTDAPLEKIKLDGPACSYFRELYRHIDPQGEAILEEKNRACQVIVAKTRGQATVLEAEGWEEKKITAKAGIKVPGYEDDHNAYFVMLYLERHPGAKTDASSLTSTREMMLHDKDMIMNQRMQKMNLEPDCKRRLTSPRMIAVLDRTHFACDSEPHQTLEEGDEYRTIFDNWRNNGNCLKTLENWYEWDDYVAVSIAKSHSKMRLQDGEKSDGILCRNFLRAYARESHGLKRTMKNTEIIEWLNSNGIPAKQSHVSGGKRAKLYLGTAPVTKRTVALLELILGEFPDFQYAPFFNSDQLPELHTRLSGD